MTPSTTQRGTELLSAFQKGVLGLMITTLFSAGLLAAVLVVSGRNYDAGERSVFEYTCLRACHDDDGASMVKVEPLPHRRPATPVEYRCWCSNGHQFVPIASKMYVEFDFTVSPPVLHPTADPDASLRLAP